MRLSTWLRISGVLGIAALTGPIAAFIVGQEPAEAHNPASQAVQGPFASAIAPVRVVYNAPIVSSADQTRPAAQVPPSSSAKTHPDRAPLQPATDSGVRSEKPPLRVGYQVDPKAADAASRPAAMAPPVRVLDLNRATAEELEALPGAGRIGKAIVRGRPYSAPDDLVRKRILSRESYLRISDQLAVR